MISTTGNYLIQSNNNCIPTMSNELSDNLEKEVLQKNQTFGIFPQAVSSFTLPNHKQFKQDLLKWMTTKELIPDHPRRMISHNVTTIGKDNEVLNDIPELKDALMLLIDKHNNNANNYQSRLQVSECYLELADEGAIYAPHEASNCLYSLIYFVNYDSKLHSPLKFRRHIVSSFFPVLQVPCSKESIFNMPECFIPYSEGDVVIFPSNLTRGYESNRTGERITLSLNIAPS